MTTNLDNNLKYHAQVLADLHSVFTPHVGQVAVGRALFHEDKKRIFIECGRKWGKQIDLEEIILTPSGFIRYGDLKIGDTVYNENGAEQSVTYLSDINISPESYRVHFCNGYYVDACAEHRWVTYDRGSRPSVRTTREIFNTVMHGKEFNHHIPYTKPLQMKEKDLLIDPYLFGCWLAHRADEEVLKDGGFLTKLKTLGVLKNKHIPQDYLLGSIEQRLALLQGLMDTDGTINKEGTICEFSNTNKNLADGAEFLIASLGMKANVGTKIGKLNGIEHKLCYRVMFKALTNVFRLTRKLDRITSSKKSEAHTIVKVERIESKPMRCISVSGSSHLYLIGKSLIPTHNTEMLIYCLYRTCLLKPNSWSYYIAPFKDQIKDLVWMNGRLPFFLPQKMMEKYGITVNNSDFRVIFKNGSFIKSDGADNYEKGRGYSATGLVVYDEFKDHNPNFHDGFEPNLGITDAPLMIIGTPPDASESSFARWCAIADQTLNSPVGFFINQPSVTNPHISKEFFVRKEEELKIKGEYWKWQKEYLAMRVTAAGNNIFPMLSKQSHIKTFKDMMDIIGVYPKQWDFYGGFDPGSAKCFAFLAVAINRYSKQVFVLDQIYATKLADCRVDHIIPTAVKKMREIHNHIDNWYCVYDYAATWFANEAQSPEYIDIITLNPCTKDLKNKENKLSLIKDILLRPQSFFISERCVQDSGGLYWEMEKYATDDNGKIPKENDHCFIGSTEVSTENGRVQIKDVAQGSRVLTRNGYRKVLRIWDNGEKETYQLTISNGSSLCLTLGHKIHTLNRGFVKVEDLTVEDFLCTERQLRLSLMGRLIESSLSLKIKALLVILDVLKEVQGLIIYIGRLGRR